MRYQFPLLALMVLLPLVACGRQAPLVTQSPSQPAPPSTRNPTPIPQPSPDLPPSGDTGGDATPSKYIGYTHISADGNRWAAGQGSLPHGDPLDIPLTGSPLWLVGGPLPEGSLWVAVLDDGRVQAFQVISDTAQAVSLDVEQLPPGAPPILLIDSERARLGPAEYSPFSHPIPLELGGPASWAVPLPEGDLLVVQDNGEEEARLPVAALPDARLLSDGDRRLLTLNLPTERYPHGVLGDRLEAGGFTIIDFRDSPPAVEPVRLPDPLVVEGISPLWVDLDQDGIREVIVTASDSNEGARLLVMSQQGDILAQSQPIGQGFRWRHQIAAAPFGPQGEWEIVVVRTPHIGGVVEFFRLEESRLERVAGLPGYSSHAIGSRNLDLAASGDFDGDGRLELLVPSQDRNRLGAIRHTEDGAQAVWHLPIGAQMTTNLSVVSFPDGRMAVGVGRSDGSLRLWLPDED